MNKLTILTSSELETYANSLITVITIERILGNYDNIDRITARVLSNLKKEATRCYEILELLAEDRANRIVNYCITGN